MPLFLCIKIKPYVTVNDEQLSKEQIHNKEYNHSKLFPINEQKVGKKLESSFAFAFLAASFVVNSRQILFFV